MSGHDRKIRSLSGRPLDLLAIGDSLVAGVGAPSVEAALPGQVARALGAQLHRQVRWLAVGRIGLDARRVTRKLLPLLPPSPFAAIVVSVGVNDVTSLERSSRWREDLRGLIEALRAHSPQAAIALVGVPPLGSFPLLRPPLRTALGLRARTFDGIAAAVAAQCPAVVHVPLGIGARPEQFSADGYHPSPASYALLGEHVAAALAPLLR